MVRTIRAKWVLQLRTEDLSGRAIASSQGMPRKSITAVLEAADAADVSWDDVKDRDDGQVYELSFPRRGSIRASSPSRAQDSGYVRNRPMTLRSGIQRYQAR